MKEKRFNRLLQRCKIDKRAVILLYQFYYPRIVKHITYEYHSRDLGQEVAQEFFVMLLKNKSEPYVKYPTAWVCSVCDHIANRIRSKENEYSLAYREEPAGHSEDWLDHMVCREYLTQIESLDPETAEIIKLCVWEDLTLKEISGRMNLNYNTVRQKFVRGKKKIKKL